MTGEFLFGIHAVSSRLRRAPQTCIRLICADQSSPRLRELLKLAAGAGIEIDTENRDRLSEICGSDKHQGCVLQVEGGASGPSLAECLEAVTDQSLFLVLDGLQDPHNLGACLRSADAAGVDAVILPRDRSARINPTVRKVAAGAAESVPVIEVTNLARTFTSLKQAGVWIYGTSGDAEDDIYTVDFRGPVALVMGSEGAGLRRLTREACDYLIKLPMLGQVESLNVSVATGICLYEIRRSRNANSEK